MSKVQSLIAVEGRVIRLMEPEQLFDGSGSEVAALEAASGEQGVTPELAKARVVLEPVAGGQAKAMLDLGEDLFGRSSRNASLKM